MANEGELPQDPAEPPGASGDQSAASVPASAQGVVPSEGPEAPAPAANEPKRPKGQLEKSVGTVLSVFGGFTIIKDIHVLEGGAFSMGSLFELHFGGGTGGGVTVTDGGVALACNADLAIGQFKVNSSSLLDADAQTHQAVSPTLQMQIDAVASTLATSAPAGNIIIIGSGDGIPFIKQNGDLALKRATTVAKMLSESLAKLGADTPARDIIIGNQALSLNHAGPSGGPVVSQQLARLLYGPGETSARSAQICVMQPRPRSVQASAGDDAGGYAWGVASTMILLICLAAFVAIFTPIGQVASAVAAKTLREMREKDDSA